MGNNSTKTNETERFAIRVEEHEYFPHIMDAQYLSSNEFCLKISELFKQIYADYEGCCYEINQQGLGTIALFFNHSEPSLSETDVRKIAITREFPEDSKIQNETVRRLRYNEKRLNAGDRYYLTKEGMEGLGDLVVPSMVGKNGKIDWSRITAEVGQQTNHFNQAPVIYTKVSLIDPVKLAKLIYGEVDEDGNRWEYGVRVMRSLPQVAPGNFQAQYMLAVERVSEKEVCRLCNLLGVVPTGLDIIR